jgi:hypothetical protein
VSAPHGTPWGMLRYGQGIPIPHAPLWYWMSERHAIYVRRLSGQPKPWTHDRILQSFRFCNVFRELDTVTCWIRENIRKPYADHEHLWFMLAIARYINLPDTLQALIEAGAWPSNPDFTPSLMTEVLDARKSHGEQIYTGAYMIRAESDPKAPWYRWSKQRYIAEIVLGRLWEDRKAIGEFLDHECDELQRAWAMLAKAPRYVGWGPFMTYEWVTDLRWTRYLEDAADIYSWANAGPGALRGLRRLRHPEFKLDGPPVAPDEATAEMIKLMRMAPKFLPAEFDELELRDIEHSLCEVDKYLRVFHGEGKPRASYDGLP